MAALTDKLVAIFKTLPPGLVVEAARVFNDQQATVAFLMAIQRLPPDTLQQVLAMSGGNHTETIGILKAILESAPAPAAAVAAASKPVTQLTLYGRGDDEPSSCGYCHAKKDSSVSFGMGCQVLTCQDYQVRPPPVFSLLVCFRRFLSLFLITIIIF